MQFKDKLEKILTRKFQAILVQTDIQGRKFWEANPEEVKETLTSIINLVDKEVIGEDEGDIFEDMQPTYQNQLRAEQRAIIREEKTS